LNGWPPRLRELLERQAKEIDVDGIAVRVCSLEHLLEMKRAGDRWRDRDDVEALEGIQRADQDRD
jgi:predicted nucleotidyltransferase